MSKKTRFDCVGAIHIHSSYSDGTGTVETIISAATKAELNYIIITDHNTLAPMRHEGWHGRTLLLAGEEITQETNHLLALNIRKEILPPIGPQQSIDAVLAQGGLAFIAHPFYKGSNLIDDPPIPWTDWQVKSFTGMEIWNFTTEFYERLSGEKHLRPFEEYLPLMQPKPEVLQVWDRLQGDHPVVGLGGLDAHAERIVQGESEITMPTYEEILRTVRMHLLLDHPLSGSLGNDKRAVYAALAGGHAYIAFEYEFPVKSFTFTVVDKAGTIKGIMGDDLNWEPGLFLSIEVPKLATIRIIRDGGEVEKVHSSSLLLPLEQSGSQRVEVYRGQQPWIISNPIYVKEKGA